MADIELVIKISEEDFEIMKHNIAVNNPLCPLSEKEMVATIANGTPLEELEDCVNRQAVLEALCTMYDTHIIETEDGDEYIDYNDTVYEIKKLPPVTLQPKMGHWIDTGSGQECSECGEIQYGYDNFRNYCANCGIKMQEVE